MRQPRADGKWNEVAAGAEQSRSIRGLSLPTLIPGVTINTGPESSMAYTQLQLQRWTGTSWEQFGNVLSAEEK